MTSRQRSFLPVLGYGPYWLNRSSPPTLHVTACMTGGLKKLMNRLSKSKAPYDEEDEDHAGYDFGVYTDADGVFCPEQGMPLLASRYRFIDVIGKGQSSVLIKAKDTFCGDKYVAIKLLHAHYMKLGPQEVDCMRRLNIADPYDVSSTLRLKTVFKFDEHYSIVFELLYPRPLADIFSSIPKDEVIPCLRKVAKNLLKALGFLQQQGVIHADLKPENILLQKKGDLNSLKVVDFGNAIRCIHEELSLYYDDYELQTLLYRAPEVMFGLTFGMEIDMWSFGCILAELFTKKPMFPGRDKKQVLEKIVSIFGPVPEELCMSGKFFSEFKHFTSKKTKNYTTSDMMKYLGCRDYAFADFVAKLLKYKPADRMTIQEAACHPFLAAELGTSFFLSPGDRNMYSPLHLDTKAYGKGPFVSSEIKRMHLDSRALLRRGTSKVGSSVVMKAEPVIKFEPRKVAEVLPMQRMNGITNPVETVKRRKTHSSNQTQNIYYQGLHASISFHVQLPGASENGSNSVSVQSDPPLDYHRSASALDDDEVIDLTVSPEAEVSNPRASYRNLDELSNTSPYVPERKYFPSAESCSSASASRDSDSQRQKPLQPSETDSFHTTSDTMMSWPKRPSPNAGLVSTASIGNSTSFHPHFGVKPNRSLSLMLRPSSSMTKNRNALSEDSNSPVSTPDKSEPNLISDSSPGGDSSITTPHHSADPTMRNRPLKKRIRKSLFPQLPETPTDEPSTLPLADHSSREASLEHFAPLSRQSEYQFPGAPLKSPTDSDTNQSRKINNHLPAASSKSSDSDTNQPRKINNHFPVASSKSSTSDSDTNQSRKRMVADILERSYNGVKIDPETPTDQNHNFQTSLDVSSGKSQCKRLRVEPDSSTQSKESKTLPDSKNGLCFETRSPEIGRNAQCDESLVVTTPNMGRVRKSEKKSSRKNGTLSSGKHSGGKQTSKGGRKGKNLIPRTASAESSELDELRLL